MLHFLFFASYGWTFLTGTRYYTNVITYNIDENVCGAVLHKNVEDFFGQRLSCEDVTNLITESLDQFSLNTNLLFKRDTSPMMKFEVGKTEGLAYASISSNSESITSSRIVLSEDDMWYIDARFCGPLNNFFGSQGTIIFGVAVLIFGIGLLLLFL